MAAGPPPPHPAAPRRLSRRIIVGAGLSAGSLAIVALDRRYNLPAGPAIDAPTAYRRATAGTVLLVDIRRHDEWAATGSPAPAHRIDMRDPGFADALARLAKGDLSRPVAVICARGVRSARLAARLRDAGFTQVFDVPEGMQGSSAGPGWLARGLPLATM